MFDALGLLVITFVVMSVISVLGVLLIYLVKNETVRKVLLYLLAIWGMVIAWCNVQSTPPMWTGSILLAWGLGFLSVIGILLQLCMQNENKFKIARILVTVSVVAGMIDCFLI